MAIEKEVETKPRTTRRKITRPSLEAVRRKRIEGEQQVAQELKALQAKVRRPGKDWLNREINI